MHRKTGSSDIIDTLHKLGYGISYTETLFIEDKWAEWAEAQSTIIPSNIKVNIPTTLVADNIDWENKGLTGKEQTHNTNSALIQQIDAREANQSSIQLEPNYNFDRKQHCSFKSKSTRLSHFIGGKKCNPTSKQLHLLKEENYNKFVKSTLTNQLWVKCRSKNETSDKVLVPSWNSFQKQTCLKPTIKAWVGYLPAITDLPTGFNVIQCIMDGTIECMNYLNLNYIFLEVLQILFAFQENRKFDKIIVRMGSFHVILCLLRTIYSCFKDSGIIELLVEAAVGT